MTLNELKNKLETEKHITGGIQIECGKKSEFPGILGIYEENGRWYIYHTKDRGGIVVLDHGNEEEYDRNNFPSDGYTHEPGKTYYGDIAEAFGSGGGTQLELPMLVESLKELGMIHEL